jgi:hypothetical protein
MTLLGPKIVAARAVGGLVRRARPGVGTSLELAAGGCTEPFWG